MTIYTTATPGAPYAAFDAERQTNPSQKVLDHRPIGYTMPFGNNPNGPTVYPELHGFPSMRTINHGKSPVQR